MSRVLIGYMSFYSIQNSAYDPDPLDPQNFGFLDPEKYADPWIRIQGAKYHQN